MQLADKSGISCDMCGMSCRTDFVYYSLDFKRVSVYGGRLPDLNLMIRSKNTHSLDVCSSCFDDLKNKVVRNYSNRMDKGRIVLCELSGKTLTGNYEYHYCVVAEVNVRISGQNAVCAKCNAPAVSSKVCKCGSVDFRKPASVNVVHRYVEFGVGEQAMKELIDKEKALRQGAASQWSSKS